MSLINQYFAADHDRLDSLYLAFKNNLKTDSEMALQYFNAFTKGLLIHIEWEENVLFPFFEEQTGMTTGPTMVMCSEHEMIKNLLNSISQKLVHKDTAEMPELEQLEGILTEHNQKEEQILYPMIDRQCSGEVHAKLFLKMV